MPSDANRGALANLAGLLLLLLWLDQRLAIPPAEIMDIALGSCVWPPRYSAGWDLGSMVIILTPVRDAGAGRSLHWGSHLAALGFTGGTGQTAVNQLL